MYNQLIVFRRAAHIKSLNLYNLQCRNLCSIQIEVRTLMPTTNLELLLQNVAKY